MGPKISSGCSCPLWLAHAQYLLVHCPVPLSSVLCTIPCHWPTVFCYLPTVSDDLPSVLCHLPAVLRHCRVPLPMG